jgi:hypothetical protein
VRLPGWFLPERDERDVSGAASFQHNLHILSGLSKGYRERRPYFREVFIAPMLLKDRRIGTYLSSAQQSLKLFE